MTALRARAAPFIDRLRVKPQVTGIGLIGGLARDGIRHFADCYSDIDITILLTCDLPAGLLGMPMQALIAEAQSFLPGWLPNFKFAEPDSGTEFNVHQHLLEYEAQAFVVWDNEKCGAYADTLEIVHDPQGQLRSLVDSKTACREERALDAALRLLSRSYILISHDVITCLQRGRIDVARDIIVRVTYEAIDVLLFLSGIWPPGYKWRLLALQALLDQAAVLGGWSYARVLRLARLDAATRRQCEDLQRELVLLLDQIAVLAAQKFPAWPADVYAYATSRVFTDKQLRTKTAADTRSGRGFEYAVRILDAEWNRINLNLEDQSQAATEVI
ncbi:MAG: hypothetical protein ACR2FU_06320 [Streptosporangiaceae bacterium]